MKNKMPGGRRTQFLRLLGQKRRLQMAEKGWKQFTYADRLRIETLYKEDYSKSEIARKIGCHPSSIGRELKRGAYEHTKSVDLSTEVRYSAELAQSRYEENRKNRGTTLKIGKDIEYANYLEKRVLEGLSPAAVLGELKAKGEEGRFKTKICVVTFYSYITKGVFLHLTNKDLPEKTRRKKNHKKKVRRQKKDSAGTSIEQRPEEIESREEFGHWEMDSVVGPQGKSKATILTLTERKTRNEITLKMPDKGADNVVKALDRLEDKWGPLFPQVFKTITVDNGTEFAFWKALEKSKNGDMKRTSLYYCHAYCSSERGTNENLNRMVRRKVPKGTNFDDIPDEEIESIAEWMNSYPRKILGYHTAGEIFEQEVAKLRA